MTRPICRCGFLNCTDAQQGKFGFDRLPALDNSNIEFSIILTHPIGRKEPVKVDLQMGFLGLGKWTFEIDMATDATEARRKLDVEMEVTEELKQKRLVCWGVASQLFIGTCA